MPGAQDGYRYWRYVESEASQLIMQDLEILRRIDPDGGTPCGAEGLDLEGAWAIAAADIVTAHNARADLRAEEDPIGPKQRWALEVLRDPAVAYAVGADLAEEALSVGRSSTVRKALAAIEAQVIDGSLTLDNAAAAIVEVVTDFGLRGVAPAPLPRKLEIDDLGVVCWMGVLGQSAPSTS